MHLSKQYVEYIQCSKFFSLYYHNRDLGLVYDYLQRLDGLRMIHGDDVGDWKDAYQAQGMSRVRVSVHTQLAKRITRSARLSFSSQVANLGEIIFCIYFGA